MKQLATVASFVLCAMVVLQLQGCAAWVSVEKFKQPPPDPAKPDEVAPSTQSGFRYTLPEPYLLVKPKADGTAAYEWIFLPNRESEYVVDVTSFLATYKLGLKTQNGFLTEATLDGTANEVAGKLAGVLGDVNEAKKNAEVTAEKAAEKAAKDKAGADETAFGVKLAAAQKALADAELTQKVAEAELAFYSTPAGAGVKEDAKVAARLAKEKADATVALMRSRLDALVASGAGAMDAGIGQRVATVAGPVLFKLVQTVNSVRLEQVSIQAMFETAGTPGKGSTSPAGADGATLKAKGTRQVTGTTVVEFAASTGIEIDSKAPLNLNRGTQAFSQSKAEYAKGGGDKEYQVTFKPALPTGDYTLLVVYGVEKSAELKFSVK